MVVRESSSTGAAVVQLERSYHNTSSLTFLLYFEPIQFAQIDKITCKQNECKNCCSILSSNEFLP